MIRLLLADDHALFLEGLKMILSGVPGLQIVGTASDGAEAARLSETIPCDLLLMDLHMPGMSGYELCRLIKSRKDGPKVIIVSMVDEPSVTEKLFLAGADGYVLKNAGGEELRNAIATVMENGRYVSRELAERYGFQIPAETGRPETGAVLSRREIEVLQYIIRGYTNAEIADILFLSTPTVQTHRKNMLAKLGLKNTASLVKYGMENKLILGLTS